MKILYLNFDRGIPVLGDKGASVHVREFVHAAAALGHEVVLACATLGAGNAPPPARIIELAVDESQIVDDPRGGDAAADLSDTQARTLRRELVRLSYDRDVDARLLQRLAVLNFQPDLVYERHALFHRAGVAIARHFRCPRILEVNSPLVEEQRRFRGLCLERTARMMESSSYRGADRIITVSDEVRDHVRAIGIADAKIHVIQNGVDVRRFGLAGASEELRAELGFQRDECVIGFIGSFKPWHGTSFLLDVFREIAAQRPRTRLLAVGDGPELTNLRERTDRSDCADRVTLVGRVPHAQIPAWIGATDIMVAPYMAMQNFYFSPLKVVEALAGGKPVVAPRLGQLVDLVHHGRTGLLYAPDDAADCRNAILDLIDDPGRRLAMGRAARIHAADHDWEHVVKRVIELAA